MNWFLLFQYTGCECLRVVKTKNMGLYLPDGCRLFDDEEVTDKEIVGEKLLFMDENPPPLNTCEGNLFIHLHETTSDFFGFFLFSLINDK